MLKPQDKSIADDLQTYFLALSDETISNSNQAYIDIQTNLIEKRNAWSEKISNLSGTNSNDSIMGAGRTNASSSGLTATEEFGPVATTKTFTTS